MGLSILPKSILNEDKKNAKVKNENIGLNSIKKKDEISFYEVDVLKSREIEKFLRQQLDKEIGGLKVNTEAVNGKIYECGELIYDGEYLKIKGEYSPKWYAHGYGKAYYDNGLLEYEGNFVYGHPHGYGEYYYTNGKIRWKGIFEAAIGIERLELWKSSLGYVDKSSRIRYGESYDIYGNMTYYGEFDKFGKPRKS